MNSKPSCYSRFRVYTLLNHGGDYKAAARALVMLTPKVESL